ncbi:ATPase [Lysinibacillus sp. KCTC 33748]|uniref:SRPBCC domain-containing protein n=1 Tax=unclassified Lysinibacillus TaxID=2636778 RepID=UPI0009A6632B|nr:MULTISPECIES: SRPBCC domain-containing protein [unclassified Lysinibacillus]OXS68741.1 ATPase [Lysinibacillus sp. KCTC 33748]SKC08352.1 Activator of Hsp90 ATPase homolog 1-like protein [Lysinibacillus sp. AC-3]
MDNPKIIGQTKTVEFQVGVRRMFPIAQEEAWNLVTSQDGLNVWLGESMFIILEPGQNYITKLGSGEIRVVKPLQQLRLTWQKVGWDKASTVQVRIIPGASNKTTISFHQEKLSNQNVREEMKKYWQKVLTELKERIPK